MRSPAFLLNPTNFSEISTKKLKNDRSLIADLSNILYISNIKMRQEKENFNNNKKETNNMKNTNVNKWENWNTMYLAYEIENVHFAESLSKSEKVKASKKVHRYYKVADTFFEDKNKQIVIDSIEEDCGRKVKDVEMFIHTSQSAYCNAGDSVFGQLLFLEVLFSYWEWRKEFQANYASGNVSQFFHPKLDELFFPQSNKEVA